MNATRPVPFDEFMASLAGARYEQLRGQGRVRHEAAFRAMQAHLMRLYRDMAVSRSFVAGDGDTFDCVPAEQQPALRLSGRRLETPPELDDRRRKAARDIGAATGHGGRGAGWRESACPDGHVPVRRVTLEMLTRFATLADALSKYGKAGYSPEDGLVGGAVHQYAAANQTVDNTGVEATINIWQPQVLQPNQTFSLSQVWAAGNGPPLQTVEAGWQVYPGFYGDSRVRFFTYYTTNNYAPNSGCYNMTCPSFVLMPDPAIVPGAVLPQSSQPGGDQREFVVSYTRNSLTGSWWLYYNHSPIGYYPGTLFGVGPLSSHANRVTYGGETTAQAGQPQPPMGSGGWPATGYRFAAYQRALLYVDRAGKSSAPTLTKIETAPAIFTVALGTQNFGAASFYYGGPGGMAATVSPGLPTAAAEPTRA